MISMFFKCSSLEDLNIYNFNIINVSHMCYMFYGCLSLKQNNASSFFKNADIYEMFIFCSSLKEIKLFEIKIKILDIWEEFSMNARKN